MAGSVYQEQERPVWAQKLDNLYSRVADSTSGDRKPCVVSALPFAAQVKRLCTLLPDIELGRWLNQDSLVTELVSCITTLFRCC